MTNLSDPKLYSTVDVDKQPVMPFALVALLNFGFWETSQKTSFMICFFSENETLAARLTPDSTSFWAATNSRMLQTRGVQCKPVPFISRDHTFRSDGRFSEDLHSAHCASHFPSELELDAGSWRRSDGAVGCYISVKYVSQSI